MILVQILLSLGILPASEFDLQIVSGVGFFTFGLATAVHVYRRRHNESYDALASLFDGSGSVTSFVIDLADDK